MQRFRFNNKPFCNDCHFFLVAVVLFFVTIKHPIISIVLVGYFIFLFRKTKYGLVAIFLLICIFLSYVWNRTQLKPMENGTYEDTFEVVDYVSNGVIIKGKKKILVYDEELELKPGDIIKAKIKIYQIKSASYQGDFDAKEYYASKGITNQGRILHYDIVQHRWTLPRLKANINDFFSNHLGTRNFTYVQTLFLGTNRIEKEVKNAYSLLYISHILTISGLHIQFLYQGLLWLSQKIFRIRGQFLSIFLIGIYVIFIGAPISCLRSFLFLLLEYLNQKGTIRYTKLDILSISFLCIALFFPLQVFQSSFIYSFIISFILLFMGDYNSYSNKLKRNCMQSVLCICSILPFLINQTNEISITGIILSCLLGFLLGKFLLPLVFITILVPQKQFEILFEWLDRGILFFGNITFPIQIPTLSFIGILLFYVIFIYILYCLAKKKKLFCFVYLGLYLLIHCSIKFVSPFYTVTFIDVGQGDSILIKLPHNKGNVLVDCYGSTVEYLKSVGVKKLDYVVLTHFDFDHMGSIQEVIDQFQVRSLLYSAYEDENKIKELNVHKKAVMSGDSFYVYQTRFDILGPIYSYNDANSNSVVVYFTFNNYSFLLTGDMTQQEEHDLSVKYKEKLKADVLKVGHHGSNTSSSIEFLNLVSPSYSIISVGENNSYGLPSMNVYERLNTISEVYMTKDSGNVQIIVKNRLFVYPYRGAF